MIILISPAKTLDFSKTAPTRKFTVPEFIEDSAHLVKKLRQLTPVGLSQLMNISEKLAFLNHERFASWQTPFTLENAKHSLLVFKGEVYNGLKAWEYSSEDLDHAQDHLRILSGLHGILRPLDLIRPYRLEMGTRIRVNGKANLYDFWGDRPTIHLNQLIAKTESKHIINLASEEYFKAINTKDLKASIITPAFKEEKNGRHQVVFMYAKKARGLMSSFIIKNRLTDPEHLKGFDAEGYRFNSRLSGDSEWVFTR